MSSKLIVVAGASGRLGRLVLAALAQAPVRVRALVRDPARVAELASERVELVAFDAVTAGEAARAKAVEGAFAVISTLQGGPDVIVEGQLALLRAARDAGARRFLPSDYSFDFFSLPEGANLNSDWRRALAMRARSEVTDSFEVVHVLQGMFADRQVLGFLGMLDAEAGALRYWGDGRAPIDWTTWEDTARFVAAAAIDERSLPERLFVSGDRQDVHGFAATWEAVHGQALQLVCNGSLDELAQRIAQRRAERPRDMLAWLPLMYAAGIFSGQALLGESHNGLFPHIRPERLQDAMRRGAI